MNIWIKYFIFKQNNFVFFSFFLFGSFVFFLRPIDDCDIFTQMRLGCLWFDGIRGTEPLIYLNTGQNISNPGWLSQLFFASLDKVGGLNLIRYTYSVLLTSSFLLVLITVYRINNENYSFFSYFFGGLIGILIMLSNSSVRPQGFSLLGCALLFYLHYSQIPLSRKFLIWALIGFLWQNLHPSLPIGILVFLLLSLQKIKYEEHLSWFGEFIAGMIILVCCCFLTPDGFELLKVSHYNQYISKTLGVSEWLPAWSESVYRAMLPFFILFVFGVLTMLWKWRNFSLSDLLFFLVFSSMTFYAARFGFYLGLLSVPFFVKCIEQLRPYKLFQWDPNKRISAKYFQVAVIPYLILILVLILTTSPVESFFPRSAINELKKYHNVKRIFAYREYAGAINYWGDRKWKCFIDGRLYLYPFSIWQLYNNVAKGEEQFLKILCLQYQPDVLFLRKSYFENFLKKTNLMGNGFCDKKWIKIFEDKETIVFIKEKKTS